MIPEFKTVYKPVKFKESFLIEHGERQAKLMMQIREIEDRMAEADRRIADRRIEFAKSSSIPYLIVPMTLFGALIGSIIGLIIIGSL